MLVRSCVTVVDSPPSAMRIPCNRGVQDSLVPYPQGLTPHIQVPPFRVLLVQVTVVNLDTLSLLRFHHFSYSPGSTSPKSGKSSESPRAKVVNALSILQFHPRPPNQASLRPLRCTKSDVVWNAGVL